MENREKKDFILLFAFLFLFLFLFLEYFFSSPVMAADNLTQHFSPRLGFRNGGLYEAEWQTSLEQNKRASTKVRALSFKETGNRNKTREELAVRELYLRQQHDRWQLDAGLMEFISFSESFGANPMDVVNASDNRDFFVEDSVFRSRPQWLLRGSYFFDNSNKMVEIFFSPAPALSLFPDQGSYFDPLGKSGMNLPRQQAHQDQLFMGKQMEMGLRFGWTLTSGGNLNLVFYRHHNRRPAYELMISPAGQSYLQEINRQIHSLGANFAKDSDGVVYYVDFLTTLNDPKLIDQAEAKKGKRDLHNQLVLGLRKDRPFEHISVVAFQQHYDSVLSSIWLSGKVEAVLASDDALRLGATLFKGVSSYDFWPKFELIFDTYPWRAELSYSYFEAPNSHASLLYPYDGRDIIQATVSYHVPADFWD